MKFLATLGFLGLATVSMFVGNKLPKLGIQQIGKGRRTSLYSILLSGLLLLIAFAQFWVLTRVFPGRLILLLLAASALGTIAYLVIGAISGFTLADKTKKIGALGLIWAVHRPALSCGVLLLWLLATLVSWVGAIWVFWTHPMGDPSARVLIAFFQFVLPQIAFVVGAIVVLWPVVTSEYLDDDFRDDRLAQSFSSIIYSTIFLLFPVWLFKSELTEVLRWTLPPFWVLLSIPLLVFVLGSLLPYFLGLYRHRSQARLLIDWRVEWLKQVQLILKLPHGEDRTQALNEKLSVLQAEIEQRIAGNELLRFYQNLEAQQEVEPPPALPEIAAAPPAAEDAELKTSLVSMDDTAEIKQALNLAKSVLRGRPQPAAPAEGLQEQVMQIIRDNQARLVEWDIRFNHLSELLELYRRTLDGRTGQIGDYVAAKIEQSQALKPQRSLVAGGVVTVITTILSWVIKTYQDDLVELVGALVR